MEKLGSGDPQQIGAYRLLARLGAGGMGQVFLARSDRGRTVAVKLVRQELAEREEFRARFRQEVAAARRVGGQWTAPVLDADTEAPIPWVATGYVAGPDLHTVVSGTSGGHGPLPERSVHILGTGLAHALRDIHAAGLIHRDLKPSNILITIDGPRVIDFGIARALETVTTPDAGLTRTGALVGSPGFMAPEQVRGERITPACDIFCLGSVLAYAATGRLPFGTADSGVHAMMYRIATEPPTLDGIPEDLQDLIRSCLHKDPGARPSPAEVLERTRGGEGSDPWLPAALVAQLGRHAIELLEVENPADTATPGLADHDAGRGRAGALPAGRRTQPPRTNPVPERSAPEETPRHGTDPNASAEDGHHTAPHQHAPGPAAPPDGRSPAQPHEAREAPRAERRERGVQEQPPRHGTDPNAPAPHALPTLVTPPAPPPAPYAQPQPQPLPPHTPPGGYGHPAPHYAYQPPAPEPPPRSGRSSAALVAVALVVALGAGGSVYAFMNAGDEKPHAGHANTGSTSPTTEDEKNNKETPTSSSPTDPPTTTPPTPDTGSIPAEYLGTWTGGIDTAAGHSTRRLVIQQGAPGDTVLSLTADGPTEGGGTYHCVFQAELSAAPSDGSPLRIGPSTVTAGDPMSSCSPGAATEVTLLPDGRLRRVNPANGESLTYSKSG